MAEKKVDAPASEAQKENIFMFVPNLIGMASCRWTNA